MNRTRIEFNAPRRGFVAAAVATVAALVARNSAAQSTPPAQPRIGRRIVTGVDDAGRSRVVSEEPVPPKSAWKTARTEGLVFWAVREVPTSIDGPIEPTPDYEPGNRAPPRGLDGRLFTWAPGFSYRRHATPTLDFIIILSGQLELILDAEARVLGPGDVVVQRGTQHAWRVVGSEPCTFAGVFVDIKSAG